MCPLCTGRVHGVLCADCLAPTHVLPRACPFCMNLLEDARGAAGAEDLAIRDVVEIVAEGLLEPAR